MRDLRQALAELYPTIRPRDCKADREKFFAIIKILIEAGADLEKQCWGSTPLRQAVCSKDIEIVTFLLAKGANSNAETFSIMSKLTKVKGRKTVPGYLNTLLREAVEKNQPEIVQTLVSAGADVK